LCGIALHTIAFIFGLLLILATLLDGFETILLPRRIVNRFRYSRLYYRNGWRLWRRVAAGISDGRWREATLSIFGPLSLLGLFGSWIACLILGFAIMQWSFVSLLSTTGHFPVARSFEACLYFSGTTYFTLGLGDVIPSAGYSRVLTVAECGLGFGFLAVIISYLPVLYQAFSRREVTISLMDARAGSPPTGGEFVRRLARDSRIEVDDSALREWERWCAELLESHLSFPVLAYYRSQHANQSWLAALTAMLDSCSLLLTLLPAAESHQAQLTFAMARHAAVDIALIFSVRPQMQSSRSHPGTPIALHDLIHHLGRQPADCAAIESRLSELRGLYEPFLDALAEHLRMSLPPVMVPEPTADNWQRSAWMSRTPGIGDLPAGKSGGDHFD
jgi:hypothetical protein